MNFDDNLLKKAILSLPHPFYVIDANNYRILMANEEFRQFGDLNADAFCYTFTHKRDKPCGTGKKKGQCPVEEIKKTGKPLTVEHIHRDKDGREKYFKVHGYPIFDSDGNVAQIIEYTLDVTDYKQTEALLIKTEQEKEIVLNSMSEMLIYLDLNMRILWANKAAANTAGLEPHQLVGDYCYEIWGRSNQPCLGCPVVKAGKTGNIQEAEITYPDGRMGLVRGYPVKDTDGKTIRIVETVLDITDQKKTEEEKNKIQAQFIQAQKMEAVGMLAGGVAHDFSNIITTIIGISDLITMDSDLDEVVRESTQEIRKSAYRAASLTQQLLAFSRKQMLHPRVINLNELIINIGEMLRRIIGEDILLETKPDPEIDPVKVDPGQMEQIIMNLAVNARDAMLEGGKFLLETQNVYLDEVYCREHSEIKPGHFVMLSVSDNGLGMDEETKKRIFEPFYTTKETGKGTGLGLSTVYGVVKQSEGFIYVYSEPNRGTTFKIYLPKVEGYEKKIIQKEERRKIATGSESILLVEDDDALREMINELLISSGYTVFEAVSGSAALEILEMDRTPAIDLLLTDVIMPEMDGRELAKRAIKKNPGIKVLYTSGYTDNVIIHHGVPDEGIFFISKPFSAHDLRQKVHEVLNRTLNGDE